MGNTSGKNRQLNFSEMRFDKSIVLIGEISSGKSTLAKKLSNQLQIPRASFGGYLLNYCKENNIPENLRGDLQDLGQSMIEADPDAFLKEVIEFSLQNSANAIFEGVRHHVILDAIVKISNTCIVVFIDATYEQRLSRFLNREKEIDTGKTEIDFLKASSHPVELQVKELKERSTFVITSGDSIDEDFVLLMNFIKPFLAGIV